MINGQMLNASTKTTDKKLAEQIAIKLEHDFVKSVVIEGVKPVRLHEACKAFLRARKGTGGYENACTHMGHWMKLLSDRQNKDIQVFEVQEAIGKRREQGAAHNTLCTFVGYWNGLQNWCAEQGWTSAPKVEGMKPIRTRPRVLSLDEEEKLFAAIDPKVWYRGKNNIKTLQRADNQDLLVVLLSLGIRKNEAQCMRWDQVDFEANVVRIHRLKGGVDSAIYMTSRLRAVMERRYAAHKEAGYVFPTKCDHKVNTDWIRDAVKRAGLDESKGKITLHTMRHTVATRLLAPKKEGVAPLSIVEVQGILGHKNINSTLIYLHMSPTAAAAKAAEILE